jgi:hypothetical protein
MKLTRFLLRTIIFAIDSFVPSASRLNMKLIFLIAAEIKAGFALSVKVCASAQDA